MRRHIRELLLLSIKVFKSDYLFDDVYTFVFSTISRRSVFKSRSFKFINQGSLSIEKGTLYLGFLSNIVGLQSNARGVLRIYKSGVLNVNGNVRVARGCKIFVSGKLEIGNGTYINPNTLIFSRTSVKIGKHCAISWDCQILDDDFHSVSSHSVTTKPIVIGNNVLIGSKSIILKGVQVGNGAVIASGSVVVSDVPSNTLVGGNPARILKENINWN